jgi:hypothetical protein
LIDFPFNQQQWAAAAIVRAVAPIMAMPIKAAGLTCECVQRF